MSLLPFPSKFLSLRTPNTVLALPYSRRGQPYSRSQTAAQILCGKRTGKQRYPSEKKKLRIKRRETLADVKEEDKLRGIWRLSKLGVPVSDDPGKDFLAVSGPLLAAVAKVIEFPVASMLPAEAFTVIRKSFDARKALKEPKFVYIVDMDVDLLLNLEPRAYDFISQLEPKVGLIEHLPTGKVSGDIISIVQNCKTISENVDSRIDSEQPKEPISRPTSKRPRIAVVGSGPAGLFAALVLAEFGANVTLIERGRPVEERGRDIGALVVRRVLQTESNFCFGEGGAGTWSDGKLVTRIGKNSDSVLAVMKTLVQFGAPESILINGKPHLGTDRLVPLLRNFRKHLQALGVTIEFGKRVDDLVIENGRVSGVKVSDSRDRLECSNSQQWEYDAVVLAVGHSARDVYQMLLSHNVDLVPKDFSVGLRIEHPQELINNMQYSSLASEVYKGRGKIPVADYKLVKYVREDGESEGSSRSCYSFCMCPGGQVVLTSTDPSEICINGMSFSRRSSKWANAALVATVSVKDFESMNLLGPLAGVQFQRDLERKAAVMGGGDFVVPVQTVTDFMDRKLSASVPSSSYRLGVKAANLHELFPTPIMEALQRSISMFNDELPGFISKAGLLHGVETRTSSPVQIPRSIGTYESTSVKGLYPIGEGAGYAGGIVSAAVDGMYAGFALANALELCPAGVDSVFGNSQSAGIVKY